MFRSGRMEGQITLLVIRLLKQDIGADPGFFEQTIIVHSGCCDIDVHSSDGAVFVFDAVNGVDAVQIVVHGIAYRIFAGFQCQTFVSHVLQCNDFSADFLLGQLFSCDMFVFQMIRAVGTAVYAVVGQIERCEHDDPVAVEIFFNLFCQFVDFLILFFHLAGKKNGRFSVRKSFSQTCFCKDRINERFIGFILICIGKRF